VAISRAQYVADRPPPEKFPSKLPSPPVKMRMIRKKGGAKLTCAGKMGTGY
jgi:hypothetical protein